MLTTQNINGPAPVPGFADTRNPVFDGPDSNTLSRRVEELFSRIKYRDGRWPFRFGPLGDGLFLQAVLDEINPATSKPWTGRKWYLSPFMTDAEIVATAFKAILTAEEHEAREQFTFDGLAIFGPHLSLGALKANAPNLDAR
jgi:hypothetical protein